MSILGQPLQYPPEILKIPPARLTKLKKIHTTPLKTTLKLKLPPSHKCYYRLWQADSLSSPGMAQPPTRLNTQTQPTSPLDKLKTKLMIKKAHHAQLAPHTPCQQQQLILKQQNKEMGLKQPLLTLTQDKTILDISQKS